VLTILGGLIIALSGAGNFAVTAIGSIILFIGFNLFVPMTWAWSAENYPTRVPPALRWLAVSGTSAGV
jgi:MFS transporter, putative metabolite:H+ symporter